MPLPGRTTSAISEEAEQQQQEITVGRSIRVAAKNGSSGIGRDDTVTSQAHTHGPAKLTALVPLTQEDPLGDGMPMTPGGSSPGLPTQSRT